MAMSQPLETISVVDAATSRLRERLFAGDYEAGQEIKDTQVASEFGIARPTARIVVQHLVNEGMLFRPPGLSARVRTFDPEQVRDIYRVRRLIELDALREIRSQQLSLQRIEKALAGFADLQGGDDWTRIAEADVNFHTAIVYTARSPRLQDCFTGLSGELRLVIALLRDQYSGGAALYEEHVSLVDHIKHSPLDVLERVWVDHLDEAQRFLEKYLPL